MDGYCFCLDDLFYYMLKTLKSKTISPNKLTYREIRSYGDTLVEYAKTKGIKTYLYLNRESTSKCFSNHQSYIKESEMYCGYKGIELLKEFSQEDLDKEFNTYMPLDIILLIEEPEFRNIIVDKYINEHGLITSCKDRIYYEKDFYFHLNDLFFNMLITLSEYEIITDSLTYKECEYYGKIIEQIAKNYDINLCLNLSKNDTYRFYCDYNDYVEETEDGIRLKKKINITELFETCRVYLSYDMLKIITNNSLKEQVVNYYKDAHGIKMDNGVKRVRN